MSVRAAYYTSTALFKQPNITETCTLIKWKHLNSICIKTWLKLLLFKEYLIYELYNKLRL